MIPGFFFRSGSQKTLGAPRGPPKSLRAPSEILGLLVEIIENAKRDSQREFSVLSHSLSRPFSRNLGLLLLFGLFGRNRAKKRTETMRRAISGLRHFLFQSGRPKHESLRPNLSYSDGQYFGPQDWIRLSIVILLSGWNFGVLCI